LPGKPIKEGTILLQKADNGVRPCPLCTGLTVNLLADFEGVSGRLVSSMPLFRPPRNRLQTPPPLHYPQAQYDHPIFKQEWSDMGLIEQERGNLFHTP
jgi:hypothetical protein